MERGQVRPRTSCLYPCQPRRHSADVSSTPGKRQPVAALNNQPTLELSLLVSVSTQRLQIASSVSTPHAIAEPIQVWTFHRFARPRPCSGGKKSGCFEHAEILFSRHCPVPKNVRRRRQQQCDAGWKKAGVVSGIGVLHRLRQASSCLVAVFDARLSTRCAFGMGKLHKCNNRAGRCGTRFFVHERRILL